MNTFSDSVTTALRLISSFDPVLWTVVARSLAVSATACALAYVLGVVLGAWLAVARFAGRGVVLLVLNTLLAFLLSSWAWWCICFCREPGRWVFGLVVQFQGHGDGAVHFGGARGHRPHASGGGRRRKPIR